MSPRGRAGVGIALGVTTLTAQVLLLRELWCVLWGSEAMAGMAVGVWLACGGLGSWAAGRAARGAGAARARLAAALAALALALPGTLLLLRGLPDAAEMPGVGASLFWAGASLGVVGFVSGALFPLTLRAVFPPEEGGGAAALYRWDMLGSLVAGLLLTAAVLTLGAGALRTACAVSCLALLLAAMLAVRGRAARWALAVGLVAVCGGIAALDLERATLRWRHPGEEVVYAAETAAGRTVVAVREGQRNVYLSGRFAGSVDAPERAEAIAVLTVAESGRCGRVLLVGSALAGVGTELRRCGARTVAVVPARLPGPDAPGPEFRVGDGRAALRAGEESFDAIVIDTGAPTTFHSARLLTRECFAAARRRLTPGGVLVVAFPANPAHLSAPARRAAGSVWGALGEAFPQRRLWALSPPGLVMVGFASAREPAPRADLPARLRSLNVKTRALAPRDLADPGAAAEVEEHIVPALEGAGGGVNSDAHMTAVLHQMAADRARLSGGAGESWRLPTLGGAFAVAAAVLLGAVVLVSGRIRGGASAGACALAAGAVGAGLEVVALVGYQTARGSLYAEVGLVLAAFMAGGALGAEAARRRSAARGPLTPRACAAALAALALCGLFAAALSALGLAGVPGGLLWALVTAAAGFSVGAAFAAATLQSRRPGVGTVYALDLGGAACGGAAAVLLVPWTGLSTAALAGALAAGLGAAGCALARR
ncbi:MAG: spermidine synthase family protein [Planctomycetota bacterium]